MIKIDNIEIAVMGKIIKIANVRDDIWLEKNPITDLAKFLTDLMLSKQKVDIFTFSQKLPDTVPKYDYYMEWDNVAAIPITTYDAWWTKKLPQVTRKSVRRGYKRGVIVKLAEFNDELVNGIIKIYNETPMRQGRRFPHYGKDFDRVKKDNSSYLNNSDFICAYYDDVLIGFIKLVYVGSIAQIMQIISMNRHKDKRTTNILIAKAVEICVEKKMAYFVYGQYIYGKKTKSPITIFKERNGFEMIKFPRYYVPLSLLGKISIKLRLHHNIQQFMPEKLVYFLLELRAMWYAKKFSVPKNEE